MGGTHRPGERGRPGQHLLVRDRPGQAARARRRRQRRARRGARAAGRLSRSRSARRSSRRSPGWGATPIAVATHRGGRGAPRRRDQPRQALPQRAALLRRRRPQARAALPPRRARPGAAHACSPWPREAEVRASRRCRPASPRCSSCPSTSASCSTCCTRSRRATRCAKAWCGCRTTRAAAARRGKLRVLVADDNPTNREVLGKILERGGHSVTLVTDGEQALDALERERLDIVLLDRNMPGPGRHGDAAGDPPDDARSRAAAGGHALGRRDAGGEARGLEAGRRRLPAQADRGAAAAGGSPDAGRQAPGRQAAGAHCRGAGARGGGAAAARRGRQRRDARPPRGARLVARLSSRG